MTTGTDVQTAPEGAEAQTCPAAEVKSGVVPYLMIEGALKAVEFYARAFGAETAAVIPPDAQGRTMHAHLYINGGSIMLSDFFPEHGCPQASAQGFNLMVQVDDIDAWWKRATDAGAEVVTPVTEMFWRARYGQLRDPFGIVWALNQPLG